MIVDPTAPKHGLSDCLLVPIAASDVTSIEQFVGEIADTRTGRGGRVNAVLVKSHTVGVPKPVVAPLWKTPDAELYETRLFPEWQVWVHVDYHGYRSAFKRFGKLDLPDGYLLDHVQNRTSTRLRWYSHPYLRLCPVSRLVNTNAGHRRGGEGMEIDYLLSLQSKPEILQKVKERQFSYKVKYADAMDLTKMLNTEPGTQILNGVRDSLALFYP